MDDGGAAGCLGVLVIILDIAVVIGSGVLAWNWIDPDSFGRGLLFVVVWGLLGSVGHGLIQLIFAGIAALFGD